MNSPVVLITGALTGIGRATALAFAREGNRVVVSGRREEAGQALAAELRALGAEAEFLRADVRFEAEVRSVVERTVERFGRIDVAVNNAGTEGQLAPIVEQTATNYEDTFSVNVLGTLLSLKHEMRVMLAQGAGSIINLSSIAGQVGFAGGSVYVASKHAVEGLTKSAALEGATAGVRVNAVAPGPVDTPLTGMDLHDPEIFEFMSRHLLIKRVAQPDDIAAAVSFLLSDDASYITGVHLPVDGGWMVR
jgi:NAD(P)-dependent dehydrogenase (short-subunit alcohol dehydrogenase family)